ncbi:MAG: DMT family transporter [Synechococcales bacterium]|nr:DMT family transporter [Synechococcales bacterium]
MTTALLKPKAHPLPSTLSPAPLALLALLLAQFAIAIGVFCIKISVTEIGSLSTIFNRCWIAGLVFLLWHQTARFIPKSPQSETEDSPNILPSHPQTTTSSTTQLSRKAMPLFLIAGVIWAACLVLWAYSLEYTNVANSTLMHDLSPLFAIVLGWLFFKHRFSQQFLIAVGITVMGVVAIGFEDLHIGMDHLLGDGLALLSAVFLALYCLLVGHLRSQFSPTIILQWVCLFGSLSLVPVIFGVSGTFWPVSTLGWLAIAGVVCFAQIIGQGLTAYSLKEISSELASLFFPLEAVFVAIMAWIGFGEHLTGLNYLGFGLVLVGIYVALLSPPEAPSHN